MDLVPGLRIGRKLRLEGPLGEGGMASVWVAMSKTLKKRVAVKVLAPELAGNEEAVERFTLEAEVIGTLASPYVPRVYEQGTLPDGTPYTVMELLEGVDLDNYLRKNGPLSVAAAKRMVSQIASALATVHAAGIVHRDVKAENIFITGSGDAIVAKLFDFGIAKIPLDPGERLTRMGAVMGTPSYMSREQLMSAKDVDARADLWALGVVTYLALTNTLPFEGETFGAVCVNVNAGVFALPSAVRSGLPPEVDTWIARALHKSLDARFQSAHELGAGLHDWPSSPTELGHFDGSALALAPDRPSSSAVYHTRRSTPARVKGRRRGPLAATLALAAGAAVYLASSPVPSWARADGRVGRWITTASETAGMARLSSAPEASVSYERPDMTTFASLATTPVVEEKAPAATVTDAGVAVVVTPKAPRVKHEDKEAIWKRWQRHATHAAVGPDAGALAASHVSEEDSSANPYVVDDSATSAAPVASALPATSAPVASAPVDPPKKEDVPASAADATPPAPSAPGANAVHDAPKGALSTPAAPTADASRAR